MVRRNGLLFQIAFLWTNADSLPDRVDRCTLVSKFAINLIPWIVICLGLWLVFGIILGVIGQPLWRLIIFIFAGKKLVYHESSFADPSWIPGERYLAFISIAGDYRHENIRWLDWAAIDDFANFRSPILFIFLVCAAILGILFVGWIVLFGLVPAIYESILMPSVSYLYKTSGWWGSALAILLGIAALWYIMPRLWSSFASTEIGRVLISHFKEWKQNHCPVYEVV